MSAGKTKNAPKITKIKFDIGENRDFILLGLVTAEPDYKLSLFINKKLGVSLKSTQMVKTEDGDISFSKFSDSVTSSDQTYTLISNRSGNNFLLSKLKNIDYLLQIVFHEEEPDVDLLTRKLRETEGINAVFNIDIYSIKDRNLHLIH
jgi:hypothetical protein